MTIAELGAKMRRGKCGGKDVLCKGAWQEDARDLRRDIETTLGPDLFAM